MHAPLEGHQNNEIANMRIMKKILIFICLLLSYALTCFAQEQPSELETRMKQLVFVGALLLLVIVLLLILTVYYHHNHVRLKEQFDLLDEERQRTQDALAIRKAFVNTLSEQIKGHISVLLHYARVFNIPGFRLNPMERAKTYKDIWEAAKGINRMLDPILDSYINDNKGISLEQKQRCQEALRSPLHGLISLTELIAEDEHLQIPEDDYLAMHQEVCDDAHQVAVSAHELILYSATDEYPIPHTDHVPLNETLKAMLDSYDQRNRLLVKTFKTTVSDGVTIETDLSTLREILYMLISNADKYATKGELTVSTQLETDGQYSVYVQNVGSTIPEEEAEKAFLPFSDIPHQQAGLGLGLALARKLCKNLDYKVNLDTTYTRGTRFVVKGL